MEELIRAMKAAFASEYAFALKAQNFHWNVEGDDFPQLHALFERIYDEVYGSIDDFAENIRKIQAYAPASFFSLQTLSTVQGQDNIPMDCCDMLQELLDDSVNLEEVFARAYEVADSNRKYGLANFLADRQDAHAKHSWMLRATLVPDADEMMPQ